MVCRVVDDSSNTQYGLKEGCLLHVSEVGRGLACGCVCPKCLHPLIANKGTVRIHHFCHSAGADCVGASETILHMLSKEIISHLETIHIPAYHYRRSTKLKTGNPVKYEKIIAKGGEVAIDEVFLERMNVGFKPDAVIISGNKSLIIEIAVTHKTDQKKKRLIRKSDTPAIEICLSDDHAFLERKQLADLIKNDIGIKKWLYHPKEKRR